jgi:hypothetical protein
MRYHHLGRGVVGLLAGLVAIGLLSLPASANTVTVQETGGTLVFRNTDGEVVLDIPSAGDDCTASAGTLTFAGGPSSGTVTGSRTKARRVMISSQHYRLTETWSYSGTWTLSGATKIVSLTINLTSTSRRTNSDCTPIDMNICILTIGLGLSGVVTSANALPTLATSDTMSLSGTGALTLTGTGCSVLIAANGVIDATLSFHVT